MWGLWLSSKPKLDEMQKFSLYLREKQILQETGVLFWVITSINVTVTYRYGELVYNIQTSK